MIHTAGEDCQGARGVFTVHGTLALSGVETMSTSPAELQRRSVKHRFTLRPALLRFHFAR
jgi:hypothetical protein